MLSEFQRCRHLGRLVLKIKIILYTRKYHLRQVPFELLYTDLYKLSDISVSRPGLKYVWTTGPASILQVARGVLKVGKPHVCEVPRYSQSWEEEDLYTVKPA